MPCTSITVLGPNGQTSTAIVCSRGRARVQRCRWCGARATRLCDGMAPGGRSCDAPCCRSCATSIGPDLDLCPDCAPATLAQLELGLAKMERP